MEGNPSGWNWDDLESFIEKDINCAHPMIWRRQREILKNSSITIKSITKLIDEGWEVKFGDIISAGTCLPELREIIIHNGFRKVSDLLTQYSRDLVLFHELVHAHYPLDLNDGILNEDSRVNNAVTEYIARNLRRDPELLRHAVRTFNLEEFIYDRSSFLAFYSPSGQLNEEFLDRQQTFSFAERDYGSFIDRCFKTTLMREYFLESHED